MKDYLLVFTENVDEYNMRKQLRFYPESDIYRYELQENYDTIIEAAYDALSMGYDSFHVISMNEDWAEMDYDIKKEIRAFKEVGVIKANYGFKRFREAGQIVDNRKIATVFPYNLIPLNQKNADLSMEKSIEALLNGAKPELTLFINKNKDHNDVSIEASVKAYLSAKGGAGSPAFILPKEFDEYGNPKSTTGVSVVQDEKQLENFTNNYKVIYFKSTAGTADEPGVIASNIQGNIVSEQGVQQFKAAVDSTVKAKSQENLAGAVSKNFDEVVKQFTSQQPGNIVINYINNFVFNNCFNNNTIDITQINIGEINNTIVGDAVAQALGWESSKELNQDTPFALAQNLLGTSAKMVTNYGNYNGEMEKSAMNATASAAANAKTSIGKKAWSNANEYFSNKNDNREKKQSDAQKYMQANMGLDKEIKEFDIKIKDIDDQIAKLEKEKDSEEKQKLLANLKAKKDEYEELQTTRAANRYELVKNTINKGATQRADVTAGEKADAGKAKDLKSETSYKNLLKKVMNEYSNNEANFLSPLQNNSVALKANILKQPQQQQANQQQVNTQQNA